MTYETWYELMAWQQFYDSYTDLGYDSESATYLTNIATMSFDRLSPEQMKELRHTYKVFYENYLSTRG